MKWYIHPDVKIEKQSDGTYKMRYQLKCDKLMPSIFQIYAVDPEKCSIVYCCRNVPIDLWDKPQWLPPCDIIDDTQVKEDLLHYLEIW